MGLFLKGMSADDLVGLVADPDGYLVELVPLSL